MFISNSFSVNIVKRAGGIYTERVFIYIATRACMLRVRACSTCVCAPRACSACVRGCSECVFRVRACVLRVRAPRACSACVLRGRAPRACVCGSSVVAFTLHFCAAWRFYTTFSWCKTFLHCVFALRGVFTLRFYVARCFYTTFLRCAAFLHCDSYSNKLLIEIKCTFVNTS